MRHESSFVKNSAPTNPLTRRLGHVRLAPLPPVSSITISDCNTVESVRRAHDRILRCRINAAFRSQMERRIYAAERGARRNLSRAPGRFVRE